MNFTMTQSMLDEVSDIAGEYGVPKPDDWCIAAAAAKLASDPIEVHAAIDSLLDCDEWAANCMHIFNGDPVKVQCELHARFVTLHAKKIFEKAEERFHREWQDSDPRGYAKWKRDQEAA